MGDAEEGGPMGTLLDDLRGEIGKRQVVAIVGAGVTRGATDASVATWHGLLKHGIERCTEVALHLPTGWSERLQAELASEDMDDLLSVAEKISNKLGFPEGGEYRRWLRETVGALHAKRRDVIEAIVALGIPIATTNYDGLIEEVSGLPPVTWKDGPRVERVLREDESGILHLHGYWDDSTSVILGIRSYEKILGDEHAQTIQRALRATRTLLFIGFGGGLADPNFGALLRWSRGIFKGSEYRHFRLARTSEKEEIEKQHTPEDRIFVLPFGPKHDDLAPFLRELAPPAGPSPVNVLSTLHLFQADQTEFDRRIVELQAQKSTLPAGTYLRELSKVAFELWQLGGRRRALVMLRGDFDRGAPDLGSDERLVIGIRLARMMIEGGEPNFAVSVLSRLQSDTDQLPETDPRKEEFWSLQFRCYMNLCAYDQAVSAIQNALRLMSDKQAKARLEASLAEIYFLQGCLERAMVDEPPTGHAT